MKKRKIKQQIEFYWNDSANFAAEWRKNWSETHPKMIVLLEGLSKKTDHVFKFHVVNFRRIATNIPLDLGDPMLPLPSASQGAHISYDPKTGDLCLKSGGFGEIETRKYDRADELALELVNQVFSSPTSLAEGYGVAPYHPPGSAGWRKIWPKGYKPD